MLDLRWAFSADTVMGGVSEGYVQTDGNAGRLTGTVSLENNGGFISMSAPVRGLAGAGLSFETRGDGGSYYISLRTTDLDRPWQSFRLPFSAPANWTVVQLRFADAAPYRTTQPLIPAHIRRISVLAVGEARSVDVALRDVAVF